MAASIPGFIYDESRQRYFRCPASQYRDILPTPMATISSSLISNTNQHHRSVHSLFGITRQREHAIPPQNSFQCYKMYCDSLLYNLKRSSETEIDFRSSFVNFRSFSSYQLTDSAINSTGSLLAMSCAKEIGSSENPVCAKSAFIFKVISDGREFKLEEVNVPFGVLKASSLQPCHGVNLISYPGCSHQVVLYTDITMQIAKLDEHHESVLEMPLQQMLMEPMTVLALNPNYLAVGHESGSIELHEEHSNNNSLLRGKNNPVLSLAFSEQRPLLFAGHRNGNIVLWDLRRNKKVVTMSEQKQEWVSSSITSIRPLSDDNYFICSAFNSKLSLWDLRLQKAVLDFNEHVNDYKCCQCLVDKAESFLISVGSDACIRIWTLHTGELVRCIEPSEYGARGSHSLPTICYSETLGGQQFNPSLLVGINNRMVQFTTQ